MQFTATTVAGAFVIDLDVFADERGFFARSYCADEMSKYGIPALAAQGNLSYNHLAGTLRGMHWQAAPAIEAKLVRCIRGAVWDVVLDVRVDSPTFGRHFGVELNADNRRALFIPGLCAHGYQTLADQTEVVYQVGHPYTPGSERGLRHDDPAFAVPWPRPVTVISKKDAAWPLWDGRTP